MKSHPRSHVIGCALCKKWSVDVTPWVSGRILTWPGPIAHLMFLWHFHHAHTKQERDAWKAKWDREHW